MLQDEDDGEKRASVSVAMGTSPSHSLAGLQLSGSIANHPALPVMCYCAASILMTVVNKVR